MDCGSWVVVGVIQAPLSLLVLPPSWGCGLTVWGRGLWVVGGRGGNTTIPDFYVAHLKFYSFNNLASIN